MGHLNLKKLKAMFLLNGALIEIWYQLPNLNPSLIGIWSCSESKLSMIQILAPNRLSLPRWNHGYLEAKLYVSNMEIELIIMNRVGKKNQSAIWATSLIYAYYFNLWYHFGLVTEASPNHWEGCFFHVGTEETKNTDRLSWPSSLARYCSIMCVRYFRFASSFFRE